MRTVILAVAIACSAHASAQDTPSWWPPPLRLDSIAPGDEFRYERPLANFNHPHTGRPMALIAIRCIRSGAWWRALISDEDWRRGAVGDTLGAKKILL